MDKAAPAGARMQIAETARPKLRDLLLGLKPTNCVSVHFRQMFVVTTAGAHSAFPKPDRARSAAAHPLRSAPPDVRGSSHMAEIKLQDLKAKSATELLEFAEEHEVENASLLRKQELMFA